MGFILASFHFNNYCHVPVLHGDTVGQAEPGVLHRQPQRSPKDGKLIENGNRTSMPV